MSRIHARDTEPGEPAEDSGAIRTTCPVNGCDVELNNAKLPDHLAEHGDGDE